MIHVTVRGGLKTERQLAELAFWFALHELMPRKKNLDVEIHLKNLEEGYTGFQYTGDDTGHYHIEIQKKQDQDDFLTCIFHEMVHVKQDERGEYQGEDHLEYYDRPSEVEAYKLQEKLLKKWKGAHNE